MNFTRIFDTIEYQNHTYPNKHCIAHKNGSHWVKYSCQDIIDKANRLSNVLLEKKYKAGDVVSIISKTGSAHWIIADLASQQIGAVVVPLHSNHTKEELLHIFQSTGSKVCFVSSNFLMEPIKELEIDIEILCFFETREFENIDLLINQTSSNFTQLEKIKLGIKESDLATIIFTSGSTGAPKGVMLSHANIVKNLKAIMSINPLSRKNICASYLPLSHVFERMTIYSYIASGVSISFISDLSKILEEIREIKPHFITSVPRILERTHDFIKQQIEDKKYVGKLIADWALEKGKKTDLTHRFNLLKWLKIKIADFLVYKKWRRALGGRLRRIVVGAAALDADLARLYSSAGIEIREGYGLTETSPAVSFNRFEPGGNRFGTVGMALPGVEIKINEPDEEGEGEICVKGPNVMMGYYKNEKLTHEVIDKEGWFHTGDVGKFVEKRFLKITDRKKDIFKTSSGKYVAPQIIERQLKKSIYISQCMVIGFQKAYVTALIIPHIGRLKSWCNKNNIHWTSEQFMVLNPKVIQFIQESVDHTNENLKSHERIKRFVLLYKDWSVETGEYSSTLKIKRDVILKIYEKDIANMYSEKRR
jgi:long-chain acyl-CoA synthetase